MSEAYEKFKKIPSNKLYGKPRKRLYCVVCSFAWERAAIKSTGGRWICPRCGSSTFEEWLPKNKGKY